MSRRKSTRPNNLTNEETGYCACLCGGFGSWSCNRGSRLLPELYCHMFTISVFMCSEPLAFDGGRCRNNRSIGNGLGMVILEEKGLDSNPTKTAYSRLSLAQLTPLSELIRPHVACLLVGRSAGLKT